MAWLATFAGWADSIIDDITSVSVGDPSTIYDADPALDNLQTAVQVEATRQIITDATTATYRVLYRLRDENNNAVNLVNGGFGGDPTLAATPSFNINWAGIGDFSTQVINGTVRPDPVPTLQNKNLRYMTEARLERFEGGTWNVASAAMLSNQARVHHFTQLASGDPEWNIRAWVGELQWQQKFLVDTDPDADTLVAAVDILFARYDDLAVAIGNVDTTICVDFDLIDDATNMPVPLVDDGKFTFNWDAASYAVIGPDQVPSYFVPPGTYEIEPLVQLESASKTYRLECNISHVEDGIGTVYTDAICATAPETLLHFNGDLLFGSIPATFNDIANVPVPGAFGAGFVESIIQVDTNGGQLPDRPDLVFGSGANLGVELDDTGLATVVIGSELVFDPLMPADPLGVTLGCTHVTFGPVTIGPTGLNATSIDVGLPQGLVYLPDTTVDEYRGQGNFVQAGPIPLDSFVTIGGALTFVLGPNAAIVDESHPLRFKVGDITLETSGDLSISSVTGVQWLHRLRIDQLENGVALNQIDATNDAGQPLDVRYSNDHYLYGANSVAAGITIGTAPDKSARLSADINLAAKTFTTHFPQQCNLNWPAAGSGGLSVMGGEVQDGSKLFDVSTVRVPYHQTCPEDPCADGVPKTVHTIVPDANEVLWTPGGGLYCSGTLTVPDRLAWGGRGDGVGGISATYPYAHRTDSFNDTDFFMSGYQVYAADNVLLTTAPYSVNGGDTAPSALLLAGYNGDPVNPDLHFPTEQAYLDGDDHWPGANFVVAPNNPPDEGASRLGGNTTDYDYDLLAGGASKYYIRCRGVFGRQVAIDSSFNPNLTIYGYDFRLSQFQASFIGSELEDSWIDGGIEVTGHSDFSQAFTGLRFDCLGELITATMDPNDNSPKNLVYWNSTFLAKSMQFEKELTSAPGVCPEVYKAYLVMGVSTEVAHVPETLHGTFAFGPSNPPEPGIGPGNLLTQVTGANIGVDSELGVSANLTLEQTEERSYTLVPVSTLRFSNPVHDPNAVVGQPGGFVTFACTINIPYFEDFKVQVMTSANPSPAALLYLTPGFADGGGETFFSSVAFDGDHESWPVASIDLAEFQQPDEDTPTNFLIHAEQKMFDLIPLSYPMRFDISARTFQSMEPINEKLVILQMDHQVDFLDAESTKLSFGAKVSGLPELNLSNLLNDQIDAAASAVSDALSAPLKKGIDKAFERFEELLADSLDAVIDPVVDETANLIFDQLCADLESEYTTLRNTNGTWADFETQLDLLVAQRVHNVASPTDITLLRDQLKKLADAGEDAASFADNLQDGLEKAIIGIDTIINAVDVSGDTAQFTKDLANLSGSASPGLLNESPSGERMIVSNLVALLLDRLLDPDVAAIVTPLLQALTSELDQELNAILVDVDPALDAITNALSQVRVFLVEVHTVVEAASGVISNFKDVIDAAYASSGEFETIMTDPAAFIVAHLQDLANDHGINGGDQLDDFLPIFDDLDKSAFVDAIKTELKDALISSELTEQFQFLLRQTLYDLQASFEQAISSVLCQITGVMKELINQTIGALEDKINPMLGAVSNGMGAAELTGYAEFNGDSLRKVRIDLYLQLNVPDKFELNAFLEIIAYTSEDASNGCVDAGEKAVEVTVGATDIDLDWISDGLRASIGFKMSLKDVGQGLRPNGVGGFFELTGGEINFQTVKITCLSATAAFGLDDNYFGAKACGEFNGFSVAVGVFFGKTCTYDPLLIVDEEVGTLISDNGTDLPLIGAYVYAQVTLPISTLVLGIPASCLFNISAGVGAGVGFFLDGQLDPIFVGKMFLGVYGEALCIVSIAGEVTLVGIVQDGSFSASGKGKLVGKVGWCPVCLKFNASAKIKYNNGKWSVGT